MVIERIQPATDGQPGDFPALFKTYVVRSVRAALARVKAQTAILPDEVRDRALHVLTYAFKLPEAWPGTLDLLLLLAPKLEQAGHRDDWIPYLEHGVTLSQQQADSRTEAELRLCVGELLRLRSKFAVARQWLDASIATFTALGERLGQARAMNQLAYVAWQQHCYDEAESLAQQALSLLADDDPERATCFSRLGLVAIDRQRWAEAERYHRDALQLRQVQGIQREIAWSLQNLGYALRGQGKYAEAIVCYEQAITILEEVQDVANWANVQVNLGIVFSLAGLSDKALQAYLLAERTFRNLHDAQTLAQVYNNKGLEYLALQQWSEAEKAFIACIDLHQGVGDISFRLNAVDGLGLAYFNQGLYDKAIATFEMILAELPQIEHTPMYQYLTRGEQDIT